MPSKKSLTICLVTGGREYSDIAAVFDCISKLYLEFDRLVIVHGDAAGADTLADTVCKEIGIECAKVPACWNKYHKAAGPIRNTLMLDLFDVDMVLAFPGNTGTADMKAQAAKRGIPVVDYDDLLTD